MPGRQGRLVFAYLVLNRDRTVGRSELAEAVWAGELPHDPADALAAVRSKVRAGQRRDCLEGRRELQLLLPADTRVDVEQARTALHEAESACALGDWARAWGASLYAQIVARRRLLGDYEAAWIDDWRRQPDDVLLRSLECYATACLGLAGPSWRVPSARRGFSFAPRRRERAPPVCSCRRSKSRGTRRRRCSSTSRCGGGYVTNLVWRRLAPCRPPFGGCSECLPAADLAAGFRQGFHRRAAGAIREGHSCSRRDQGAPRDGRHRVQPVHSCN